jgi:hypothetical protein
VYVEDSTIPRTSSAIRVGTRPYMVSQSDPLGIGRKDGFLARTLVQGVTPPVQILDCERWLTIVCLAGFRGALLRLVYDLQ